MHEYPKHVDTPWKENWYFNFIDREHMAWGINHISLMRHTQMGRFTAVHVVDDEILPYSNLIPIGDLRETTDGVLSFEIIEPFKRCRVTFNGPWHQVELEYEALFPAFYYGAPDQNADERALSSSGRRCARGPTDRDECLVGDPAAG